MSKSWTFVLSGLVLVASLIAIAASVLPDDKLHLVFCDVGQGDAILAVFGTNQILIDGGPDDSVLSCLSKHIPFWDRKIEVVVLTHPQADHMTGLVEVLRRYEAEVFATTPVNSSTATFKVLKDLVGGSGVEVVNPTTGTRLVSGLIYLDIVYPSTGFLSKYGYLGATGEGDVLGAFTTDKDPNEFSVVLNISFGQFDALLTGDIMPAVTPQILSTGKIREVEVLKVPHHGSKNGLTKELLEAASAKLAVISVGKNNRYGHPHQEVLQMLLDRGVKVLRTDQESDIEIISDGESWWIR